MAVGPDSNPVDKMVSRNSAGGPNLCTPRPPPELPKKKNIRNVLLSSLAVCFDDFVAAIGSLTILLLLLVTHKPYAHGRNSRLQGYHHRTSNMSRESDALWCNVSLGLRPSI